MDAAPALAEQDERGGRSRARRRLMLGLARQIFTLHDNGATSEEIGRAVDRPARTVRAFAASRGVLVSRSATTVRYAVTVTVAHREALRRLAVDYGASPAEALEDLLTFALSDHAAIARRTLRVTQPAPRARSG